ncbi:MAG: GHKL domain-containing protein [Lachnospiraceae bacterium]|nr:GHKL domain-containing protein [Lachnospiraceae bacterium]
MLQKLRIKFFVLAMGLLFLVLVVIMGTVNLLNYQHILDAADNTLGILLSNDGRFPDKGGAGRKTFGRKMSPELPFETRFFTVRLAEDGTELFVDTGKIAAVTSETAVLYAKEVMESHRKTGFVGEYRYAVQEGASGNMIVFLDCGRQLSAANSFLFISAGISFVGFLVVALLLYILSARIVKPIAESHEKQRQFITNASHDLKTPITIIDADLDVLEMEQDENEWMQDIRKQTRRLTELIQELVFLSRMDEKENHFHMIDFPISDVVEETAQSFEALAVTQEKTFTMQIQPMLSYCGDEKTIHRLVAILLDNALKYSDEKGSIMISFEKKDRALRLTVHNTCEEISTEDIKHLFDRFYRVDKSRNSQTGGYGIGLSIAKAIVDAHNSTISVATKDSHSLTVTVIFPVK